MRNSPLHCLPALAALTCLLTGARCESVVNARGIALLDTQRLRLVPDTAPGLAARPPEVRDTEVLVAGGSLGGVAAALGACESGRRVILTEEGDWVGGQVTAQAVSALDENPYVGHFGGTRLYARFRQGVRSYYP